MPQNNEYDKTLLPESIQISWVRESDIPEKWLAATPESIKKIGEKRIREYAASRHALALTTGFHDFKALEIENHQYLKHHPEFAVSLSHTRGISAAIASTQLKSIGIDLEHADRKFKSEVSKFFLTDQDDEMDLLILWSAKEAAFKAIAPLGLKETLVLKDLVLKGDSVLFQEKAVARWNSQVHDGLITSVAWV
tara:strand:- start:2357 stop:2938 length:582 start_codon:yes stop_codon:yes gene_type:complete